jgi:hypothetical protein
MTIPSRLSVFGTASAAQACLAITLLSTPPTISPLASSSEQQIPPVKKTSTRLPLIKSERESTSSSVAALTDWFTTVNAVLMDESDRPTTAREKLIGEIRSWALFKENWDGEGASAPLASSLREAVAFAGILGESDLLPEAMLFAAGHAGLFWDEEKLYADLEFLGDGRIAYFIERQGDKHKGVLKFDSKKMPTVFPALLAT